MNWKWKISFYVLHEKCMPNSTSSSDALFMPGQIVHELSKASYGVFPQWPVLALPVCVCVCVCVCACVLRARETDFMSCHMLMRNLTMAKSTFTGCYKAIWGIKGTGRLLDCIRYLCVSVLNTGKGKWRTFSVEPRVDLHLLYYELAASISQFIKSALSISPYPTESNYSFISCKTPYLKKLQPNVK